MNHKQTTRDRKRRRRGFTKRSSNNNRDCPNTLVFADYIFAGGSIVETQSCLSAGSGTMGSVLPRGGNRAEQEV